MFGNDEPTHQRCVNRITKATWSKVQSVVVVFSDQNAQRMRSRIGGLTTTIVLGSSWWSRDLARKYDGIQTVQSYRSIWMDSIIRWYCGERNTDQRAPPTVSNRLFPPGSRIIRHRYSSGANQRPLCLSWYEEESKLSSSKLSENQPMDDWFCKVTELAKRGRICYRLQPL